MKRGALLALGLAALGCGTRDGAEDGRVAITTAITEAELYVDAHPAGRLVDGRLLDLPPGPHVLEARRGRRIVARREIEVHPGVRRTEPLDERSYREREVPRGQRRRQ